MLFPHVPEWRLSNTDSGTSRLVFVKIWDVVELVLERLACCILAVSADLADAGYLVQNHLQLVGPQLLLIINDRLHLRRKIGVYLRDRNGVNTGEGKLIDNVVLDRRLTNGSCDAA